MPYHITYWTSEKWRQWACETHWYYEQYYQETPGLLNVKCFTEDTYSYSARWVITPCKVEIFSHIILFLTKFTAKVRELFHTGWFYMAPKQLAYNISAGDTRGMLFYQIQPCSERASDIWYCFWQQNMKAQEENWRWEW